MPEFSGYHAVYKYFEIKIKLKFKFSLLYAQQKFEVQETDKKLLEIPSKIMGNPIFSVDPFECHPFPANKNSS